MEPFDEALDRRIWSLADNRLAWHKAISETRRKLPQELEYSFVDFLQQYQHLEAEELDAITAQVHTISEEDPSRGENPAHPLHRT